MPGSRPRAYDLAAAALAVLCPSAVASAAVHDVHTHRFENGLTLHVAPGHPAPVAAVQAWLGVGSADEGPDEAGVAHVVEHMLFKGSAGYGPGELVRAIERGGGEINAWTSVDHTVYHAVLGADHVDAAIHALGDALIEPLVDPGDLAREREVILEEIRQGSDDPARSVAQNLFATAFVAHPYRRPVIGTPGSVSRIGERELLGFFRRFYVADNLTLVVAGDVDPARVQRSVERRFRAMPSGRPARRAPAEPPQTAPRAACSHREVGEAYLAVGFHIPPARHPDLAALDVAAIVLGQGESARLPRLLRDDEQLVTSAYASLHALRDPGLLVLSATARPGDAPRTVTALVDRSWALVDDLSPAELDKARIAVEAAFVRQLETAQGRARSLGWHATTAGDPQFGHVYLDRIRSVRRHDVARVMRRYLRSERASVAAILPGARARAPRAAWARQTERRVKQALAVPAAPPAPAEQRVVLASGLVLLVRRDPSVPIVALRAVWPGGQRVEDDGHAGASALLARMLTRGCAGRDPEAVADRIDRLGGALGGVAGRNSFGVTAEWLARSWRDGFELTADCILEPQLASAELVRERRLLIDDQRAQAQSPSQVAFRLFSEALYGGHPYARDALGIPDAVAGMSRAELTAFYRARYPVSGMTLAVVGDVEIDEVVAWAKQRFGRVPRARAQPAAPRLAAVTVDGKRPTDREVYRYLDRAQAHLVLGFPGATVTAADRFALEVLVAILGGQSGRLFAELRDRRALVYRVSAHSVEGVDPGFVAIYLSCAPDKVGAVVAGVRDQLAALRADGVTAAEVERAQRYLIGSHRIVMQRRGAVANAMAYHEAYGLGWQSWADYDAQIRAVTPAQVAATVAAYLRDDRAITATVRPPAATPGATRRSKLPAPAAPLPPARHPPPRPRGSV